MSYTSMIEKDETLAKAITDKAIELVEDLASKFEQTVKSLRQTNAQLKSEADDLRSQLAYTKQTSFPPTTEHKGGFKCSHALQTAISKAAAEQRELSRAYWEEAEQYRQRTLDEIASRQKKLLETIEYQNAVQHGSYSEAMIAITRKKAEVVQHGVTCQEAESGHEFKGLYDSEQKTLFTFETLNDSTVTVLGSQFQVMKAELSPVNAGNTYHLRLLK